MGRAMEPSVEQTGFAEIRRKAMVVMITLAWINVAVAAGLGLMGAGVLAAGVTALLALAITFSRALGGATGRIVTVVGLQAQAAVIVAAMAGNPWQVDGHMYFFALLAVGVLLIDSRAILAGAALVAVHHLSLNFAAAELIYPGGSDLARTLIHAVILGIETGALLLAIRLIDMTLSQARQSTERAEQELANAKAERERADTAERDAARQRDETLADLQEALGEAIRAAEAGDFSKPARSDFDTAALNSLATSVNGFIQRTDETLGAAIDALARIAAGDLTARMAGTHAGRFADLQAGIGATTDGLSTVVTEIRVMAETMQRETSKIAASATDQAQRAESQAAIFEVSRCIVSAITRISVTTVESPAEVAPIPAC
ncbi:MAG: methyl-accepting chemotaxis protein, partial [Pseudomonadota bacterium]